MKTADRVPVLRLHMQNVDADLTQIVWLDEENGDLRYKVGRGVLDTNASKVRDTLQDYLRAFVDSPEGEDTRSALTALVEAGHTLYEALFASRDSDPAVAEQARTLYEQLGAGALRLLVKVDPKLMFPWSLVVPSTFALPEGGAALADVERYFWCMRHELLVSTFGVGAGQRGVALGEYRALALLHRQVYDDAGALLTRQAEQDWLKALLDRTSDGISFTSASFKNAVARAAAQPGLRLRFAYLLGHASGDTFEFSEKDQLQAGQLAIHLRGGGRSICGQTQQTVLFLNGCETAGQGDRFSFGELVTEVAIAALIGTEVKVPDLFAFRYALAFLQLVLNEGYTLRAAADKLRREHLPISLAYSLYAAEGLTLAPLHPGIPSYATAVPGGEERNYSRGRVKCEP